MRTWEYLRVQVWSDGQLTKLGADGWELVAINSHEYHIFKREIIPLYVNPGPN